MPRIAKTTSTTSTETPAAATVETVATPAVAPAPAVSTEEKPKRQRKEKAAAASTPVVEVPASTPVVEAAAEVPAVEAAVPAPVEEEVTKASRVAPTRESVLAEHAEILSVIDQEIERLRESGDKVSANSAKFLRALSRRVKSVQNNSARVMKQRLPSARRNNNSGFLKPVKISAEMAKFTGLDANELHSRVDVTGFLCKYIKEHNLSNPTDKRCINADAALSKLLNYDPKKATKPLTYPHIQSLMKPHFTKVQ